MMSPSTCDHNDIPMKSARNTYIPKQMPSGREWPRITVVTPTLNRGSLLEKTIKSVIDQEYPNLEYIVMDGGSDDSSRRIIEEYSPFITYWESEKDRGQSHAINKGFKGATGEILTWLNSDDIFEPDALFSVALAYDQTNADLIVGVCKLIKDDRLSALHMTSIRDCLDLSQLLDVDGSWLKGCFFYQPEVFFTKRIWDRIGGQVDEGLFYSMDFDLWCKMAAEGVKVKVIGKPLCQFLIHPEQKTIGNGESRFKIELISHAQHLKEKYNVRPEFRPSGRSLPRIMIISDLGIRYGAGIANERIATALRLAGHQVSVLDLCSSGASWNLSEDERLSEILKELKNFDADIVLIGNIHASTIAPSTVTRICARYLTFLIAHDLWWLTGRSAFPIESRDPLNCEKEDEERWAEYPRLLPGNIGRWRKEKRLVFRSSQKPIVLAYSSWTEKTFSKSLKSFNADVSISNIKIPIPNSFRPQDRIKSRREFNLPIDKFIILSSASNFNDERKGVHILFETLRILKDEQFSLVLVGQPPVDTVEPNFPVIYVGEIYDENRLSRLYCASDVVVSASLMETLGQTLIEAAACGVPSIAFSGSGTEDAIKHGTSGLLVDELTPSALAEAINVLRQNQTLRNTLSFWGPIFAANEHSFYISYHSLYQAFEMSGLYRGGDYKRKIDFISSSPTDLPIVHLGVNRIQGIANDIEINAKSRTGSRSIGRRFALGVRDGLRLIRERCSPFQRASRRDRLPNDFDWAFYLALHEDLRSAGLSTEKEATNHYLTFGCNEGRSYNLNSVYKKSV